LDAQNLSTGSSIETWITRLKLRPVADHALADAIARWREQGLDATVDGFAKAGLRVVVLTCITGRLIRVGDLDDVQWVIQICGMLTPLRRLQGDDRADRRVGDRGYMSIPRVGFCPGDDRGGPDLR
jgi:hypothetical protein